MSKQPRVLIVDDEESLRHMLSLALSTDGYHVWTASSGAEGLEAIKSGDRFDICLTDVRMPGMDGLAFIETGVSLGDRAPTFIAMSAYGDEKLALEALRRGAFDYISKPFQPEDLSLKLRLVVERKKLKSASGPEAPSDAPSQTSAKQPSDLSGLITVAPSMKGIIATVRKVANFPTTVLITGETGTGKERIAGSIHSEGKRAGKSFVAINCGAIPENLLESQLFGHMQGAFTDAHHDQPGLFEAANNGTLFLDEIAELPLSLQVKLLRALVEKEIRRVGSTTTIPVDVRVIAATAKPLEALVKEGRFREDLFYRLNVVSIHLPPLRERKEDVPALVHHFLQNLSERLGLACAEVSEEALRILSEYSWPGNVRELENALERALVLSDGGTKLTAADLDDRFDHDHASGALPSGLSSLLSSDELSLKLILPKVEKLLIHRALERTGGNRSRAASLLGISNRALLYKMKEHALS